MTNQEWIDMFRAVPESEHTKLVIVLHTGADICVDTLVRFEKTFLVLRGRLGGTIEEARAFMVPYDQMMCLRIERVIKIEELEAMFPVQSSRPTPLPMKLPTSTGEDNIFRSAHPTPTAPSDPAAASRLLLEKIKASRAANAPKFPSQG